MLGITFDQLFFSMTQRYTLFSDQPDIESVFNASFKNEISYKANYNIGPGSTNPVVYSPHPSARTISPFRWGLVPPKADDINIGFKMINARIEELNDQNSYKKAFQRQRCIIPANGFYEWQTIFKKKVPFYFRTLDQELFGFAGIYERWVSKDGNDEIMTFALVTSEANALVKPLKDDMPVILKRNDFEKWLDPVNSDTDELLDLLKPYPSEKMSTYRVGQGVNDSEKNEPELIHPVDA